MCSAAQDSLWQGTALQLVWPDEKPYQSTLSHGDTQFCFRLQELFQEPVIAADGFTYSRAAIVSWMKSHNTSPMTNATMPHDGLVSNRAIRKALQDFGGGQGGGSSSPAPAKAPQNQGFSVVG